MPLMANRFVAATMVLIVSMFSLPALAQNAQGPPRIPFPAPDPGAPPVDRSNEGHLDGWYKDSPIMPADPKAAPAPRHDLSGIWEPAAGWLAGVQFMGAQEYPSDGKHFLPFTPAAEEAFKKHKAGFGTNEVPIALNNDPFDMCDPIGFPTRLAGGRTITHSWWRRRASMKGPGSITPAAHIAAICESKSGSIA